jgi:hypothetical protein
MASVLVLQNKSLSSSVMKQFETCNKNRGDNWKMATIIVKNNLGHLLSGVKIEIRPSGIDISKLTKKWFQKGTTLTCGRCFLLDQSKLGVKFEIYANNVLKLTLDAVQGNIRITL